MQAGKSNGTKLHNESNPAPSPKTRTPLAALALAPNAVKMPLGAEADVAMGDRRGREAILLQLIAGQHLEFRSSLEDIGHAGFIGAIDFAVARHRGGGKLAAEPFAVLELTGTGVITTEDAMLGVNVEIVAVEHGRANVRAAARLFPGDRRPSPICAAESNRHERPILAGRGENRALPKHRRGRHPARHAVHLPELFPGVRVVGP